MLSKKRFAIILILIVSHSYVKAQQLTVTNTCNVNLSGSIVLNFNNTNSIINNGVFNSQGSNSTVIYSCNCNATLGGSSSSSFYNFTFNVSPQLTLNGNIQVDGDLKFTTSGLFELNNNDIDLGNGNGKIMGETNNARITGINGGRVLKTQVLNAPSDVNPGNLGIEITSSQNLGSTQIIRGHQQQFSAGNPFSGVYRYFDFFPSTGNTTGMNITTRFNYFDGELISGFNKSDLTVWDSPDGGTNWLLLGDDSKSTTSNWVEKTGIDFMNYRLTLTNTISTLPVKLINFNGNWHNADVDLVWTISNDGSLHHFELEHSSNGTSFSKLANINPSNNLITTQIYSYTDQHPYSPVSYYRLKVVDNTQKYFYSNVVKLKSESQLTASIYPNPATDHTFLYFSSLTNGNTSLELFNAAGQMVRSESISYHKGENIIEISLANLPESIYIVRSAGINIEHNTLIKN